MDDLGSGQWLTYAEAGRRFGISQDAARQLAKRRKWQRRTPNEPNAPAQIYVLGDAYVRPRTPVTADHRAEEHPVATGRDRADETINRTVATALLRSEIDNLRSRLEAFEADREHERRIASETIRDLRARLDSEVDERRRMLALLTDQRPPRRWWRRWFRP